MVKTHKKVKIPHVPCSFKHILHILHTSFIYMLLSVDSSLSRGNLHLTQTIIHPLNLLHFQKNCLEANSTHAHNCTHMTLLHTCTQPHPMVCAVKSLKYIHIYLGYLTKLENICTSTHNAIWLILAACPSVGLLYQKALVPKA